MPKTKEEKKQVSEHNPDPVRLCEELDKIITEVKTWVEQQGRTALVADHLARIDALRQEMNKSVAAHKSSDAKKPKATEESTGVLGAIKSGIAAGVNWLQSQHTYKTGKKLLESLGLVSAPTPKGEDGKAFDAIAAANKQAFEALQRQVRSGEPPSPLTKLLWSALKICYLLVVLTAAVVNDLGKKLPLGIKLPMDKLPLDLLDDKPAAKAEKSKEKDKKAPEAQNKEPAPEAALPQAISDLRAHLESLRGEKPKDDPSPTTPRI